MPRSSPPAETEATLFTDRDAALAILVPLLRSHQRFLVTSHARPDGDAVGSALGMMHLLTAMGKEVVVTLADPVPRTFLDLPGTDRIQGTQPEQQAEIGIVLECDSVERTGFDRLSAARLINIDHHRSGTAFADLNWIEADAPAVGTMLYELALACEVPISPELATCLYTAVLTDTVHFTLPSTTAETFGLARHLVSLGADASGIAEAVYNSYRPERLWVLSSALRRFQLDLPIAWSAVTQAEIAAAGAETEDCEGIVNYVIGVAGVQAGVFLRELPEGRFRASLRSKGRVDVAAIAEEFGGGGHRNASGCSVDGPLEHAVAALTEALRRACTEAAP